MLLVRNLAGRYWLRRRMMQSNVSFVPTNKVDGYVDMSDSNKLVTTACLQFLWQLFHPKMEKMALSDKKKMMHHQQQKLKMITNDISTNAMIIIWELIGNVTIFTP